jgi:bifunctional non-homologous end joining protein LigD
MAGLETYRAKRNFGITAEPRGRVAREKGKALRFVIQRHAATRLHYDFRLELDGVYKSWAVTKVPSLDPATKRLAVEVEDHPLEYGTFEGTIPQGQYGGGTVQLWDYGTWTPQSDDPRADLAKGQFKIEMHGKRMHGRWALIRLRDDKSKLGRKVRHNWLLIKEKDEFALPGEPDALLAADTSVKTGRTLEEIASSKKSKVWQSSRKKDGGSSDDEPSVAPATVKKKTRPARASTSRARTLRKKSNA